MEFIKIENLYPHPNNPRKEIRELDELVESIKAKGVLQNLTVVEGGEGVPDNEKGYTVVIGHRRLEAAKRAGLTSLPCNIVSMDAKEQVSVMLLENMQRNDLTLYEQAQGFQLMLDLGETISSISQKTGLSKTTVRHRVKLAELDQEKLKESTEREPLLTDFIELEQVKDVNVKNKLLDSIGTTDFKWKLTTAIREQKERENKDGLIEYISSVASEKEDKDSFKEPLYVYPWNDIEENKKKIKEYIGDETAYYKQENTCITIYLEKNRVTEEEKALQLKKQEEKQNAEKKKEQLLAIAKQAQEMRERFVKEYHSSSTSKIGMLVGEMARIATDNFYHDPARRNFIVSVLGLANVDASIEEKEKALTGEQFENLAVSQSQKVLLTVIMSYYNRSSTVTWNGKFNAESKLSRLYDILSELGYEVSEEEKQLIDGTHPLYQ